MESQPQKQGDDPPYLSVGTEVSAKYKGAFCEAKIRKVVRSVKCRVTYKQGLGTATVTDDQIKGTLRVGASVEARHNEKKDFVDATITKIQDCSQYTVVFDDGDITTLRRTALCLKSGRHFAESETLDQLPLTHPEHFGNPVIGGRRGRRSRQAQDDSSEDEGSPPRGSPSCSGSAGKDGIETEPEIGRVVCVELGDKKKKDNWFPGLVVAPTAQDTVRIRVRDDYLVRSFKDARYYTVPKKEATEFTKELGLRVENGGLKVAVEKALLFLEKNELPPHWDRDSLFGNSMSSGNSDTDGDLDSDTSDDEPREEKDHFVAQLYKFMDDRGTPINNCPMIGNEDIDLYRLFRGVYKLGGYNRVTNQNQWKSITRRLGISMQSTPTTHNLVKHAYKKFLHSFEDFYRKLGCTMVNHPRGSTRKQRPGRSLIRDKDRNTPVPTSLQTIAPIKLEKEKVDIEEEKKVSTSSVEEDEKIREPIQSAPREIVKEEEKEQPRPVRKKECPEESVQSGQESDINVEAESAESSSSEKSQKPPARSTPVPLGRTKTITKIKDEPKKKSHEKRKQEGSSSSVSGATIVMTKKDISKKDDDTTKTRSKSKEDTKGKETKETRTPSHELEKNRVNLSTKPRRLTDDELKKQQRGRKKREDIEKSRGDRDDNSGAENTTAPCYKGPVQFGDRLKVYYGPTHESKVTYEAKVIGIQQVDGSAELDYLVHYTGWNTRYDEWIKATRIAQNFTQTQGRVKRTKTTPRPQTPSTTLSKSSTKVAGTGMQGRRRAQSVAPSTSKTSTVVAAPSIASMSTKDRESTQPMRSTTPLSVASSSSRTKSPATPAGNRPTRNTRNTESTGIELRRRTRRMSGHTDLSVATESEDSDAYETDTTEPERARTRSRNTEVGRRREVRRRVEDRIKPDENSDNEDDKETSDEPRRTRRLRRTITKIVDTKSEPDSGGGPDDDEEDIDENEDEEEDEDEEDDDDDEVPDTFGRVNTHGQEEQPKGRDFDLNQIRSELKGFDKAVKMEVIRMEPENSGDEDIKPHIEDLQEQIKEEPDDMTIEDVPIDIKPMIIQPVSIKPAPPSPSPTEDVYEFKEPEPFEFEVRNKRDSSSDKDKSKKRVFDEEPKSPNKKKQKTSIISMVTSKESKSETEIDSKRKIRRTPMRRPDDNVAEGSNTDISKIPQYACMKEPMDKVCEPISINSMKNLPRCPTPPVVSPPISAPSASTASEEQIKDNTTIDLLFTDLPGNDDGGADADDPEDRLIISEAEVAETGQGNLFTYQQEIFPVHDTPDRMEFNEETELASKEKEERPSGGFSVSNLVTSATPDRKILECKLSCVASLTTTTLATPLIPAPISTRLPATSTIEEKLSAAAMAFRQSKPKEAKRDDDSSELKKNIKETAKKTESYSRRTKVLIEEQIKVKQELKKEKDCDESSGQVEERSRETPDLTIKQKDEELMQTKTQMETELKKLDTRNVIEQHDDDWTNKDIIEIEMGIVKEEPKEFEKQKRKKVLSQEFVDSTDSSDSEQKLVIDNSESCEEKHEPSNFDIKLKAELDLLQESQLEESPNNNSVIQIQPVATSQQNQLLVESKIMLNIKTEEEGENMNLLCEEEIPGSPAPTMDLVEHDAVVDRVSIKNETIEKKLVLLEMPFASAPTAGGQSTSQASISITVSSNCAASVPHTSPSPLNIVPTNRQQPVQQSSQLQQQPHYHHHQQPQQQQLQPEPLHQQPPVAAAVQPPRRESNDAAPVMDNTPPTTPDSTISNISGSPRGDERTGASSPMSEDNVKMNRDSFETDNDDRGGADSAVDVGIGVGTGPSGYSEDDTLSNIEGMNSERQTKAPKRAVEESISPKKRKRNRKSSECGSNAGKKTSTRHSTRQTRQAGNGGSDSDDTSEGSNLAINNSASIVAESHINGITDLNSTSKSPKPTKYNFYVELDPELDSSQRIAVLLQKLTEIKKTYNAEKVELAGIERRRKKLRRREREAMKAAKAETQQACS